MASTEISISNARRATASVTMTLHVASEHYNVVTPKCPRSGRMNK
jgi:hypothetical protein